MRHALPHRPGRALALTLAALALLAVPAAARGDDRAGGATTVGVIGDIPYGDALIAELPTDIAEINADPDVRRVIHLGDIKNGSSRCDDGYSAARFADFQTFEDPLVYTPGDNEWTDCHRASNGGYLPTERLDAIRNLYFPRHGRTLGRHERKLDFQSEAYPENVAWTESHVEFGTVHLVGSNDDQDPWFMWDSSASPSELTAFAPVKAMIAERAARFGRPVWLLEGDSHILKVDRPAGMPPNLTRVVVQGSTKTPHEWLRLHVEPHSPDVLSCESVVFGSGATTP